MKKYLVIEKNGFVSQIHFDKDFTIEKDQKVFVTDFEDFDFGKDYWLVNGDLLEVELGSSKPGD